MATSSSADYCCSAASPLRLSAWPSARRRVIHDVADGPECFPTLSTAKFARQDVAWLIGGARGGCCRNDTAGPFLLAFELDLSNHRDLAMAIRSETTMFKRAALALCLTISGSSLFRVGTAPGFEGGFADPSWAKRSRTPSLWRPTPAGPPGRQGI